MRYVQTTIWLLLTLWAAAVYCRAQGLPDAPSASKSVCYRGSVDASGQFMYVEVDCRAVTRYGAPAPYVPLPIAPKPGFFMLKPNRTNRQTLLSGWFLAPHLIAAGAAVSNVTRSRAAGAGYGDALGPLAAVTGFDYLLDRFVCRAFSVADAGYAIALRTYGATARTYR